MKVEDSLVSFAAAGDMDVRNSMVLVSAAGDMAARDSFFLVSAFGDLGGDARVLMDAKSALLFGAGLGMALAIVGRLLGRGKGRSSPLAGEQ